MTNGQRVVTGYFALYVLVPLFWSLFVSDDIATIYIVAPMTLLVLLLPAGAYVLFRALYPVRFFPPMQRTRVADWCLLAGRAYLRVRLAVAILAAGAGLAFFNSGLNAYRYTTARISEAGSGLLFLGAALNVLILCDACYCIFVRWRYRPAGTPQRRLTDVLIGAALLMFANGSASLILAGLAFVCLAFPRLGGRLIFARSRLTAKQAVRATVGAAVLAVLIPAAWLAGETIKRSSAGVPLDASLLERETDRILNAETLGSYGEYLVATVASHYYSLRFAAATVPASGKPGETLRPLETLAFRVDYLLGTPLHVPRPAVGTLSRLNYVRLTQPQFQSDRAGTSPGLVASFVYVFGLPLGILACALYARSVARGIDTVLGPDSGVTLSMVGVFLLLLFVLVLFQSPFDLLLVVDEAAVTAVLLAGIVLAHAGHPAAVGPPTPALMEGSC